MIDQSTVVPGSRRAVLAGAIGAVAASIAGALGRPGPARGASGYFDSTNERIGPEHIMASGALPPGFPPVEIDGEDDGWDAEE